MRGWKLTYSGIHIEIQATDYSEISKEASEWTCLLLSSEHRWSSFSEFQPITTFSVHHSPLIRLPPSHRSPRKGSASINGFDLIWSLLYIPSMLCLSYLMQWTVESAQWKGFELSWHLIWVYFESPCSSWSAELWRAWVTPGRLNGWLDMTWLPAASAFVHHPVSPRWLKRLLYVQTPCKPLYTSIQYHFLGCPKDLIAWLMMIGISGYSEDG